jgi:hypothetical protein
MDRRWGDDVVALGQNVDSSWEVTRFAEALPRMGEVQVDAAPAGLNAWRIRQLSEKLFGGLEIAAVAWIDIDDDQAALGTRDNTEV